MSRETATTNDTKVTEDKNIKSTEKPKRSLQDRLKSAFGGKLKDTSTRKVLPLPLIGNKSKVKGGLYLENGEAVNAWKEPYSEAELEAILDSLGVD